MKWKTKGHLQSGLNGQAPVAVHPPTPGTSLFSLPALNPDPNESYTLSIEDIFSRVKGLPGLGLLEGSWELRKTRALDALIAILKNAVTREPLHPDVRGLLGLRLLLYAGRPWGSEISHVFTFRSGMSRGSVTDIRSSAPGQLFMQRVLRGSVELVQYCQPTGGSLASKPPPKTSLPGYYNKAENVAAEDSPACSADYRSGVSRFKVLVASQGDEGCRECLLSCVSPTMCELETS